MKRIIFLMLILFIGINAQQSKYANYPGLVFREVFNNSTDTYNNGGVPTSVTYSQGSANLNGSSSTVVYNAKTNKLIDLNSSMRCRIKPSDGRPASNSYIIGQYLTTGDKRSWALYISPEGLLIFVLSTNGAFTGISSINTSAIFADGVASNYSEIVITKSGTAGRIYVNGTSLATGTLPSSLYDSKVPLIIGAINNPSNYFAGSIDFVEIYNRALSASEIKNLYDGVAYKDLSITPLIDFNSTGGLIKDFTGKTITNTVTTIKRSGSIWSADFNGSTSKLDYGNIDPLTGDITICGWVNARGYGELNAGRIIDNSKLVLGFDVTNSKISLSSDAVTFVTGANNSLPIGNSLFFVATRSSSGVVNFYIGDSKTPPTLSDTANQNAGTPTAGSNIIVGNRSTSDRTFNGLIPMLRLYKSILTQAQFTQIWSSTVGDYQ